MNSSGVDPDALVLSGLGVDRIYVELALWKGHGALVHGRIIALAPWEW